MGNLFVTASAIALLTAAPALADNISNVDISSGSAENEVVVNQETGNPERTQDSGVTVRNNARANLVEVDQIGNFANATSNVVIGNANGNIDPSENEVKVEQNANRRVISTVRIVGDGDENEIDVLQENNLGAGATRTTSTTAIRGDSDHNNVVVEQVFGAGQTAAEIDILGDRNDILVRQADSSGPNALVVLDNANRNTVQVLQTDNNLSGVTATVEIGERGPASSRNRATVEQTAQNLSAAANLRIVGSDNDLSILQRNFTTFSVADIDVTGDSNVMTHANGRSIEQATVQNGTATITIEGSGNSGGISQSSGNLITATILALEGSDGNMLTVEQTAGGLFNTSTTALYDDSDGNTVAHRQTGGLFLQATTTLTDSDDNTVDVTQTGSGLLGGHNSLTTLEFSSENTIDIAQDGGGQYADSYLILSDGNSLTVDQSGTSNVSYIDLTNAHDNVVGHAQTGTGASAGTYISGSTYNSIAVTQGH
jgi:hypothetical protein